jgi:phosphatidate cytidylyltransferase
MLFPRILTALVGLPLLVAGIYFGELPFFFLVLAIVLLGLHEFYFLAAEGGYRCYSRLGVAAGALLVLSVFLNGVAFGQMTENQITSAVIGLILVVLVARGLWRGPSEHLLSEFGLTFFGLFYVAWSLSHLLLIRSVRPQGMLLTFFLFGIIWAEDILAYLVGIRWGRLPIAKSISPKKTLEGTVVGLVAAVGVAAGFQRTLLAQEMKLPEAALLGALIGGVALISDLGESLVKRSVGVKDSSALLPGHGGILDRFDSFLLTAPFFYYYWAFFKH